MEVPQGGYTLLSRRPGGDGGGTVRQGHSTSHCVSLSIQKFNFLRGWELPPKVPKLWGEVTFLVTCQLKITTLIKVEVRIDRP